MASAKTYSYDPEKISVIIGGRVIEGFSTESIVKIVRTENRWNFLSGIKSGMRIKNPNKHATLTLELLQGSDSNAYLWALLVEDLSTNQGTFDISIQDRNSSSGVLFRASCPSSWINKEPDYAFSGSHESRIWNIECGVADWSQVRDYVEVSDT